MKIALLLIAVAAVICAVLATNCGQGDDTSMCNMTCQNSAMVVGCDHGVCTCVPASVPCSSKVDCENMQCEKHKSGHCLDGYCDCVDV
ncbi:hypothetical protein ACF0H5_009771 [Mactra antiquata]